MVESVIAFAKRLWQHQGGGNPPAATDRGNRDHAAAHIFPVSFGANLPRWPEPLIGQQLHERAETTWFGGSSSSAVGVGTTPLHAPVPRRLTAHDVWAPLGPERSPARSAPSTAAPYRPVSLDRPLLRYHRGGGSSADDHQRSTLNGPRGSGHLSSFARSGSGLDQIRGNIIRPLDAVLSEYLDQGDIPLREQWPMDLPPRRKRKHHLGTSFPRVELPPPPQRVDTSPEEAAEAEEGPQAKRARQSDSAVKVATAVQDQPAPAPCTVNGDKKQADDEALRGFGEVLHKLERPYPNGSKPDRGVSSPALLNGKSRKPPQIGVLVGRGASW
mmetsp:Transcript_23634/g.55090  ORF Transcript_23634/g.55090 Transcript_23634/m.55090 type:complete len:329 (-) Transcript_23634:38-1024(-)